MAFDPGKNGIRRRNVDRIREDDPTPRIWLTGLAFARASKEHLQLLNPDVHELLLQAGLSQATTPKLRTDISNAYEQAGMLARLSTGPTVRAVTSKMEPFLKRHESRMMTEIGADAVERAWNHVRNRMISRGPVV